MANTRRKITSNQLRIQNTPEPVGGITLLAYDSEGRVVDGGDAVQIGAGPGLSVTQDNNIRLGDHNTSLTNHKYFYITEDDNDPDYKFKNGFRTEFNGGDAAKVYEITEISVMDSFYGFANDYTVDYNDFNVAVNSNDNLRVAIFHNLNSYRSDYTKQVTAAALLDASAFDSGTSGWFNYTIESPKSNQTGTEGFSLGLRAYSDTQFPQRGRYNLASAKNEIWFFVDPITQIAIQSSRHAGHTGMRLDWYHATNTVEMYIADPISEKGIDYDGDYELNFGPRTLVTKQFVEGLINNLPDPSNITLTYNNILVGDIDNLSEELEVQQNSVVGRFENDIENIPLIEQYVDPPSTKFSVGIKGQRAEDINFIYECIDTNNWVRYAKDMVWEE